MQRPIVRTVADGYGVAFVSELAAAYPLERGNLVAIPFKVLLYSGPFTWPENELAILIVPVTPSGVLSTHRRTRIFLRLPEQGPS